MLKLTTERITIVAVTFLLLSVVALISLWRFYSDINTNTKKEPVVVVPIEDLQADANIYAEKGDLEGGLKFFDEQAEATSSDEDKQRVLLYKSYFASNLNDNEVALEAAKEAESVKSDFATIVLLAELYEEQGNKQKAIEYYQKALDESAKTGGSVRRDDRWRLKIEELST